MHIPRSGERTRDVQSPGSSSWVAWQSCLLDDLLQQWFMKERNQWGDTWYSSSVLPLGNYWSANTGNSTKPGKSQKKSCKPNNSRTLHRMENIWVHNKRSGEWSYYSFLPSNRFSAFMFLSLFNVFSFIYYDSVHSLDLPPWPRDSDNLSFPQCLSTNWVKRKINRKLFPLKHFVIAK